jgi:integrase
MAHGPYADVIAFLAYTGLRWGEMAALHVGRVDLNRRGLEVAEAVTEPRAALIFGTTKTHERRSVPYPRLLDELLRARCAEKQPGDLVFTGPDGGVVRSSNFRYRWFDPALSRMGVADPGFPRITPHDLRHTAVSLAIAAGARRPARMTVIRRDPSTGSLFDRAYEGAGRCCLGPPWWERSETG